MPRNASALRYSGSKTIRIRNDGTNPLCRGMPNFDGNSLCARATIFIFSIMMGKNRKNSK